MKKELDWFTCAYITDSVRDNMQIFKYAIARFSCTFEICEFQQLFSLKCEWKSLKATVYNFELFLSIQEQYTLIKKMCFL